MDIKKETNNKTYKNPANIFLANVNHEVRTPINAIMGFSELLKNNGIDDHKKDEFIDIIIDNSKRLIDHIDNLILLSNLDSNMVMVEERIVDINCMLNDLFVHYLQKNIKIREGKINLIKKEFTENNPLLIKIDETLTSKLFRLLIDNAIKFTEKGNVEFGYLKNNNDSLTFFVKDQGIGIDNGQKEVIFNKYLQGDINYTTNYSGCGLGLAICNKIINLLNGELWFESDKKRGTTFYFNLPLHEISNPYYNNNRHHKGQKSILVVEDDEPSSLFIKEILEEEGFYVYNVYCGSDAAQFVMRHKDIDLVLMDVKLPDIDGLECTRIIKNMKKDVPVILQTAYEINPGKMKKNDLLWDDILYKPINRTLLLDKIGEYIKINKNAVKL
jgi:CheY-like chemotaxis protein